MDSGTHGNNTNPDKEEAANTPWNPEPRDPAQHKQTLDDIKKDAQQHGLVDEDHPFPSKGN